MRLHPARTALVAALTVGALAACTDSTSPLNQSAVGTYVLQTVNGNPLPYTFTQSGSQVSIQGDTYTLYNDYTYTENTDETVYNGYQTSSVRESEAGRWSQSNNAVTFTPTQSTFGNYTPYTASLTGGGGLLGGGASLTISINGTVSVYAKQ